MVTVTVDEILSDEASIMPGVQEFTYNSNATLELETTLSAIEVRDNNSYNP